MGAMPYATATLTPEVRAFLEQPMVASIASVDPDGTPRRWCTNLMREPRVALSVVDHHDLYRWIGITAEVDEVVEDVERSREDIVALAHRYHPEGPSASSIAGFRSQPRVTFLLRVTGVHDHLED